jgi:hypothetical protein
MSHEHKLKIARKLISNEEKKKSVPLFLSKGWLERKRQIQGRVIRREEKAKGATVAAPTP